MIGEYLETYTFDYLMAQSLAQVPDSMDKRQGSIIYDALAPACYRLAELYNNLRNVYRDTFVETATGEALNYRCAEQGLTRYAATFALKKAYFTNSSGEPMTISIGARFATISDTNPIVYAVESAHTENDVVLPGYYNLRCETAGVVGNEYSGRLTNITYIQGLASAVMSDLITPARDQETDDELRDRYFEIVNTRAFGGNIADYNQYVRNISGVGDVQIYPVWNGGGTVKLSIVDTEYNPCSDIFIKTIKELMDPTEGEGQGLGIAPIGHTVTVSTPTNLTINISMTVAVSGGYTSSQLITPISEAINAYFSLLRKEWGVESESGAYSLSVFVARIVSAALQVPGVANITNVKLNGSASDIVLLQTAELQQLPKLGTVTINA